MESQLLFLSPHTFDITEELNELKKAFTCPKCHNLLLKPVALNTCGHIFCDSCLDNGKLKCCVCKCAYNEVDIIDSPITESVVKCIENIENIRKPSTKHDGAVKIQNENFEIVVAEQSMKKNPKGETPLHFACKKGNVSEVSRLIKSGVDINAVDFANWTPLHEAVQAKQYECVEMLLQNGALIDVPGFNYMTPLHEATHSNVDKISELLLKYGANTNMEDLNGLTPLDYVSDDEKLKYFKSIQPATQYVPKVFVNKDIIAYGENLSQEKYSLLTSHGVKFINLQDYQRKDDATHFIIKEGMFNINLLFGVLKGIFIVDERWTSVFPLKHIALDFIPETYNDLIRTSIYNKLERKPNLFSGINFHIVNHEGTIKINRLNLDKTYLTLLIKAGGGKIMTRPPALRTVENEKYRPYHARECAILKQCSNYIIYNEQKPPSLLYNMQELQHRSSKWLIDCILEFKICDK